MTTTMKDVLLTSNWQNIYTLASVTPATAMTLQNKSSRHATVVVSLTQPLATSVEGWAMYSGTSVNVDAGDTYVWVKGDGPLSVQVTV